MKPVRVILYFLVFYICLLILDWLKGIIFPIYHHGLFVRIKTVTLIVGGILIMRYTLSKKVFNKFAAIYIILWLIYFLLELFVHYGPGIMSELLIQYLFYTQLMTPLPFIIYWIVATAYEEQSKKALEKDA
jgi:hypothetical protein